jgi:hypothetical protein
MVYATRCTLRWKPGERLWSETSPKKSRMPTCPAGTTHQGWQVASTTAVAPSPANARQKRLLPLGIESSTICRASRSGEEVDVEKARRARRWPLAKGTLRLAAPAVIVDRRPAPVVVVSVRLAVPLRSRVKAGQAERARRGVSVRETGVVVIRFICVCAVVVVFVGALTSVPRPLVFVRTSSRNFFARRTATAIGQLVGLGWA